MVWGSQEKFLVGSQMVPRGWGNSGVVLAVSVGVGGASEGSFCTSPRNTPKRYNIMAFNSADRVTLSTWAQVSGVWGGFGVPDPFPLLQLATFGLGTVRFGVQDLDQSQSMSRGDVGSPGELGVVGSEAVFGVWIPSKDLGWEWWDLGPERCGSGGMWGHDSVSNPSPGPGGIWGPLGSGSNPAPSALGFRDLGVGNTGIWGQDHSQICIQARMERDMSNKRIYAEEELPESGAGSEFHRKLREEARRKKYGIVLREFRAEDQPWLLRVNGKTGRK